MPIRGCGARWSVLPVLVFTGAVVAHMAHKVQILLQGLLRLSGSVQAACCS